MSPEEKKLIEETLKLARDNNEMLHSMRRSMRVARVMNLLYWLFIIGSAFGVYYFLQPYLDQLKNVYGGAGDVLKNLKQFSQ